MSRHEKQGCIKYFVDLGVTKDDISKQNAQVAYENW